MKENKYVLIALIAAVLLLYFTTAWNSSGYYHADEHYQIIEFAGLKLGTSPAEGLPWEFKARLRPALQPYMAFAVISLMNSSGISDPYHQTFMLRLLTVMAVLLVFLHLLKTLLPRMKPGEGLMLILLAFFLWYQPGLLCRFSSETWTGLTFVLALSLLLREPATNAGYLLSGAILGLSFLFRYQSGIMILGLLLWLVFVKKEKRKNFLLLFSGMATVLAAGVLLDSLFYGSLTFTAMNYTRVLLDAVFYGVIMIPPLNFYRPEALSEVTSAFGDAPWYFYVKTMIFFPAFPLGILIFLSFILLLLLNRRSVFLWIFIPFILFNSLIVHKEERFLFPLLMMVPFLLMEAWQALSRSRLAFSFSRIPNGIRVLLLVLFLSANLFGMGVMAMKSAGLGRMHITEFVHRNYGNKPLRLIAADWSDPYNPWVFSRARFYEEKDMQSVLIHSLCELDSLTPLPARTDLLVIRKFEHNNTACAHMIQQHGFVMITQSIPAWIALLNESFAYFDNGEILELYVRKEDSAACTPHAFSRDVPPAAEVFFN